MSPRRRTRGASTSLEFALVLPLIISFLLGSVEYGVYFNNLTDLHDASRQAGRVAAGTSVDDDPAAVYATELDGLMTNRGIAIGPAWGPPTVQAQVTGDAPFRVLETDVGVPYQGVTGLVPHPQQFRVIKSFRLEDQVAD
jgi:hypothetical protein